MHRYMFVSLEVNRMDPEYPLSWRKSYSPLRNAGPSPQYIRYPTEPLSPPFRNLHILKR